VMPNVDQVRHFSRRTFLTLWERHRGIRRIRSLSTTGPNLHGMNAGHRSTHAWQHS
jgi:hypothetical protein